jgi:hypothetical protein
MQAGMAFALFLLSRYLGARLGTDGIVAAAALPDADRGGGGKCRAGGTFGYGAHMDRTPTRDQSRLPRFPFQELAPTSSPGRSRTVRGRPAQSRTAGVAEEVQTLRSACGTSRHALVGSRPP